MRRLLPRGLAVSFLLLSARPSPAGPALDQLRALAPAPSFPPAIAGRRVLSDEGIDPAKLERLLARAQDEHSDAVVILRDGNLVLAQGAVDQKIFAMSATKSIVSLAVGRLIDEGRIKALDQPVSDFYPEWKEGEKSGVTVRMLLNHTSGLDTERGLGPEGAVAHALASRLVFPPGSGFAYNNNAVDLLAGVIEKASGLRADLYIADRFFAPLGITDWDWAKDKVGTPLTAGELLIRPADLAKLGQLVLDGGSWGGRRLISSSWLELSAKASQPYDPACGLLWWLDGGKAQEVALTASLFELWLKAGVEARLVKPLRPLVDKPMKSVDEWRAALADAYRGQPALRKELDLTLRKLRLPYFYVTKLGPTEGFSAQGWLGQYLVIDPARRLVGVRMRRARDSDYQDPSAQVDVFADFPDMVHALVPAPAPGR